MGRHKVCLHHKVAELSVIDQLPKQALCRFLTDIHKPCRNPGIIKEIDPAYITVQDRCKQRFRIIPLEGLEQAENEVDRYSNRAVENLKSLPVSNPFLEELLLTLIHREK